MIIPPFFVSSIGGVIWAGYGWWLLGWLGFMLFFFFVWEAQVLRSHCPLTNVPEEVAHAYREWNDLQGPGE